MLNSNGAIKCNHYSSLNVKKCIMKLFQTDITACFICLMNLCAPGNLLSANIKVLSSVSYIVLILNAGCFCFNTTDIESFLLIKHDEYSWQLELLIH